MDIDDLGQQCFVGDLPSRGLFQAFAPPVIGRRGDAEDPQYELDRVPAVLDEPHDHLRVWPSSEAKYALAERSEILRHAGGASWLLIGADARTIDIAADYGYLYRLLNNGRIYEYQGTTWDPRSYVLGSGSATPTMIVGTGPELYKLFQNGAIFRWNL
ncbi:hypothetical protein [Nocardia jinanensis]|uniref:Uncharacterized protein n=1 Tax=Nocardia jinanensis TaxID=382504 RepID=A0A917RZK4_9NOCA|nr:hypothetical protein [Nocardia jinanensis]GGL47083.1 hypothetical protein GCM10011588_72490 [Nocardia jinanensis]